MTLDEAVATYFTHLQALTVLVSTVACFVAFAHSKWKGGYGTESLGQAATWGAMPNGVAFLFCAAYPAHAEKISDMTIALTMGGLALLLIPLFDLRFLARRSA